MEKVPDFLTQPRQAVGSDQLASLTDRVEIVRDLQREKADLEEKLKGINATVFEELHVTIPDLMSELGIMSIDIPSKGNQPGMNVKAGAYYKANIAASWSPERKDEAFRYLEGLGHGDLIKTSLSVAFNREDHSKAKQFAKQVVDAGFIPQEVEVVSHQTLTAWLKDQVTNHNVTPDLDKIGATVGRVARIQLSKGT